ncbi:hypothetical protein C7K25_10610 [Gulosibacter molinativorax]|uniref:Membrane-anchored protein n=2 Tax=Gulosibacter molinativorax TaxID=256821 RepID=A0ABT7C9F1_9MICO|nr:hypothetical protein [Gulosibacter molinativorax]
MLNKVPEITLLFWLVKMMSTTVGETGADLLSGTLGWGLPVTSAAVTALLIVALIAQFRAKSYEPAKYWVVVLLISVAGTLVSDMLVDLAGVPLTVTTAVFAALLAIVFFAWWSQERTLSIHTINTRKREAFYWAAILVTFALGTSGGDLLGEALGFGYELSALVFLSAVLFIAFAHFALRLNAVFAFWAAYVLTRPLGASFGDLLSQPISAGGLGMGTVPVSIAFTVCIVAAIAWFVYEQRRAATGRHREMEVSVA